MQQAKPNHCTTFSVQKDFHSNDGVLKSEWFESARFLTQQSVLALCLCKLLTKKLRKTSILKKEELTFFPVP